jgi:hypothetical protein
MTYTCSDKITLVITRLLGTSKSKAVCPYDFILRGDDSKAYKIFCTFCPIAHDSTKEFGVLHKPYKASMRRTWREILAYAIEEYLSR